MDSFLKHFYKHEKSVYVTEFGHSSRKSPITIGPWSRELYILHYVVKGSCDFSGCNVRQGQAFLISKGQRHYFKPLEDYEHYWIGFDGKNVEELFKKHGLSSALHQVFFVENTDFVKSLLELAENALYNESAENEDSVMFSVFTSILPLLKSEAQVKANRITNHAEKVRLFIEANHMYPIKMADIAKEVYISEKHMCRLFIKTYKMPPQQFLLKTRMENAKKLLCKNELSVTEVAYSVGYTSAPAFSRTFSRYFGISPGAFRKRNK